MDLGQIDLRRREGFHSHRTDLMRPPTRNQFGRHVEAIRKFVAGHGLDLGLRRSANADPETVQAEVARRIR